MSARILAVCVCGLGKDLASLKCSCMSQCNKEGLLCAWWFQSDVPCSPLLSNGFQYGRTSKIFADSGADVSNPQSFFKAASLHVSKNLLWLFTGQGSPVIGREISPTYVMQYIYLISLSRKDVNCLVYANIFFNKEVSGVT